MFVTKLFLSFLFLIPLISSESVFSKTGKRYTYEYNVDLQVNPNVNDVKKIGYNIYFDVYPKNVREYVVHITQAKPYHGDDIVTSSSIQELKSPFLVKRVKSRNSNKYSDYKITFTNPKESIWSQNLKKSLVSLFEVDYRPQEVTYDVKQETLSGTCDYHYVLDRRPQKDIQGTFTTMVTRMKDPDQNCDKERSHSYFYNDKVPQCPQKTDLHHTHDYFYTINEMSTDDIVIKDVEATEKIRLVYGFHHEITYPIISKQKLHLVTEEGFQPEQSSNQIIKDLFEDKNKGEHLQTTLEGIYQPYYGHDQIEDKYLVEKITELAPKKKALQSGQDTDFKKLLHYDNIVFKFMKANYDEIKRLYDLQYNGVDPFIKSQIFFTFLGQVPHYDGIKFVLEKSKELIDGAPTPQMKEPYVETLFIFLHSTKFHFQNFTNENGEHFINFCKNDFIKNDRNLNKVCWLAFSRMINSHCTKSNPTCSLENADNFQEQTLVALNVDYKDQTKLRRLHNEILMLVIKVVKNFNLQSGLPVLRAILLDRTIHHIIRNEAAWVYYFYNKFDKITTNTLLNVVNDRKEDYELRLALFFAVLKINPRALMPFVIRLRDNFVLNTFQDNQQLIHGVHDLLYYSSIQNKTICNRKFVENSDMLYKLFANEYKEYFGYKDITETSEYHQMSNLYKKIVFMIYASSEGPIPESVFFSYGDSFHMQSFFIKYNRVNKYMKLFSGDRFKPELNNILNDFIKSFGIKKAKDNKMDSYTLTYSINNYDVFFIYSDESSPAIIKDFKLFYGSSYKNIFFIDFGSFTDTGFPYYFHAKQSKFFRPNFDRSKFDFYLPFATHGAISSTVYLPMTDYYLIKGRTFTKYYKLAGEINIKNYKYDGNILENDYGNHNMEINGEFILKQNEYYEKVNKYHFINTSTSLSHFYFIDGPNEIFTPEKYIHNDNKMVNSNYESYLPFGNYEPCDEDFDTLNSLWLPIDTLFDQKYMKPLLKNFASIDLPVNYSFILSRKFLDEHFYEYKFSMDYKTEKWFYTNIKVKYGPELKRYLHFEFKNYILKHNTLVNLDIFYPKIIEHNFDADVKKALKQLPRGSIEGKLYYTNDMEVDPQSETNLYTTLQGVLYKKSTPDRILEYENLFQHCLVQVKSYKCVNNYFLNIYKYDSLDIDIKIVKPLPDTNGFSSKYMYKYLNHIDHVIYDSMHKLETNDQVKMHLSSLYRYQRPYYNTINITNGNGNLLMQGFKIDNQMNFLHLMPNSYFYSDRQFNAFHKRFFDFGFCIVKHDYIETFDEHKLFLNEKITYEKPMIITEDHNDNDFLVTLLNKYTLNIIYYKGMNLTLNIRDKILTRNNENMETIDLSGETIYKNKNFVVTVTKYDADPMVNIYFENGLSVQYTQDNLLMLRVSPKYIGALAGICGNYDHNWSNDLVNKNGDEVSKNLYVTSWEY